MEVKSLSLPGLKVIAPHLFPDKRGLFFESYRQGRYEQLGISCPFVQDNASISRRGALRGMHFQSLPGQDKLVTCLAGRIFDVAVDIRKESPTFGKWEGVILDDQHHLQLFIPIGFAHGFCVLSETAHVLYKVSSAYNSETEKGFRYDDPFVGIDWPVSGPLLSERDRQAPLLREVL